MSLYGALYSGVSGLKAQGNKIGIISDNISNVNTVGYKAGSAQFETLVTSSNATVAYSPGGVKGGNRQLVDKQGLLLTTDAPTDIAISGNGFFTVNTRADGSDQPLYTRAGSFRQDNLGNFVNAAGFFLQGWPLDREGRLPGEPGNLNTTSASNLDSLQTVNVQSVSGVAAATSTVEVGMNLNAGLDVFEGPGDTVTMDTLSTRNYGIRVDDIIVPDEYGLATTNNLRRGDRMTVSTGSGLSYTYQYGGFSIGRNITTAGAGNVGDGGVDLTAPTLGANPIETFSNNVVEITQTAHGYSTGDIITISGVTGVLNNIPAAEINGARTITVTGANTFTITTTTAANASNFPAIAAGTVSATDRRFTGNILNAVSATDNFFGSANLNDFTTLSRSFTITNATAGTVEFQFATTPVASTAPGAPKQFNNLNSLATAINDVVGLTARVVDGRLVVGAENSSEAVTFANRDAVGDGTDAGVDWVSELDLTNVTAGTNRFNNMQELADQVNLSGGISARVINATGAATVRIFNDDPLDTIRFQDYTQTPPVAMPNNALTIPAAGAGVNVDIVVADAGHTFQVGDVVTFAGLTGGAGGLTAPLPNGTFQVIAATAGVGYTFRIPGAQNPAGIAGAAAVGGATGTTALTNQGSLLAELGLANSLNNGAYVPGDSGNLGPAYDATGAVGENMASGDVTAQSSRSFRVYDALGAGHDLTMGFLKIATNRWAVEIWANPETDVSTTLVNGQIATGTLEFNGNGSLRDISTSLSNALNINWTNGAVPSTVTFDWGTAGYPAGTVGAPAIGDTDGMSQFDSPNKVNFVNQNGAPVGELLSVAIDEEGFVIASYSNGETQKLYQLAIADFTNPNGLKSISGNVFAQTEDSGEVNLREAGQNGVGEIASAALESSNVELAEQLTDMIVAQRAYQANTRVITTTDQLLDELNRLVG